MAIRFVIPKSRAATWNLLCAGTDICQDGTSFNRSSRSGITRNSENNVDLPIPYSTFSQSAGTKAKTRQPRLVVRINSRRRSDEIPQHLQDSGTKYTSHRTGNGRDGQIDRAGI